MKVGVWTAVVGGSAGPGGGDVIHWVCMDGWNGRCCGGGGDGGACWRSIVSVSVSVGVVVYGMMWPAFSSWMRSFASSCSDAKVARYRGVRCDVECALVPFLVLREVDVLKPLARVVVLDLYGDVKVVLDGDEKFGRVSSEEVVVKQTRR